MNIRSCILLSAFCFLGLPVAQAQVITACDWEVAHPSDPDHVGPGKGSGEVDTARAIAACENAVSTHPDVARFHYQLGRALVYHADQNDGDDRVGMPHLVKAAEMGSEQAMFVVGLMHKRVGDTCAAEPWTRQAADAGLKSARLTYVDDALSGAWADCGVTVDPARLTDYLDGAASQVSGYYEGMLLGALRRGLPTEE